MLTFLLKNESARFCIRNENASVHHRLVDRELRKLPAKIVAKFSVMKVVSRDTSDNTTRKTSLIATYVRGNSIQSSCWRTTLDYVIQMLTVTFAIPICCKVHSIVTNKRTRRMHSNVKRVIMFTQGKTTWKSTWRLAGQILCESEKT